MMGPVLSGPGREHKFFAGGGGIVAGVEGTIHEEELQFLIETGSNETLYGSGEQRDSVWIWRQRENSETLYGSGGKPEVLSVV